MSTSASKTTTDADLRSIFGLVALGAIWGASFLFQRVSAPEFGSLPLAELRLAFGALVLLPLLWPRRHLINGRMWLKLAGLGAINSAVPFALFAWASLYAPAGIVAITNATTVLFTALVGALFFGEAIGWRRGSALLIGFAGVVVLAVGDTSGATLGWAVAAGCAAALMYGVSVHVLRHYLTDLPPTAVAAATLSCAALMMLPLAIATWPEQPVSALSWGAAVLLGVLCTGIAYAVYYRLVLRIGPSQAVTVTYLVPLFAVAWAWWLLDEPLTWSMALAGMLILGSVGFSQFRARQLARQRAAAPVPRDS